jgi:hypothetical protein
MASSSRSPVPSVTTVELTFDTKELRAALKAFMRTAISADLGLGTCKFGAYAFFDYDEEPIYVGQTCESVASRVGRHLTNQRTDAVAMSVLDPYEVYRVEVWPLPEYQSRSKKHDLESWKEAKVHLDRLEASVFQDLIKRSKFGAVLNEKVPATDILVPLPECFSGVIVSETVAALRGHADVRLARRAQVIAKLAQVVSERDVQPGLRRTLWTQAKRLEWLAHERYKPYESAIKAEDLKEGGSEV